MEQRRSGCAALFIYTVIILVSMITCDECPQNCTCNFAREIHSCANVSAIPNFLHPNNVIELSIASPNLTVIKESDFKGFFKLKQLNISGGRAAIDEHAFDDIKDNVEMINLSDNQLQTIPENVFTNLTRLKYLEFNYNKLTRLNGSLFRNLPKLNIVKFEYNKISDIDDNVFQNVPKLETIYFFNNQLTKIPFKALQNVPSVKYLNMGFNKITSVGDRGIQYQWNDLTDIELDSNQISDMTVFPKYAPNLEFLNLGFNQFSTISASVWTNLDSLKHLNLNGNKMKKLDAGMFCGLENVDYLFLRNMPELETIGARVFSDLKNLSYVDLAYNSKLTQIHDDAFQDTEITSLYLDHSGLTTLSQKVLPFKSLAHLSLANNSWACDCHLRWILDPNTVFNSSYVKSRVQGLNCSSPTKVMGKLIGSLEISDLICVTGKSDDYKSRVETGIIVAVVCFVVMTTFMIIMKCRKRIMLRVHKYYMYRQFRAGDKVFTVGETDNDRDDDDQLL